MITKPMLESLEFKQYANDDEMCIEIADDGSNGNMLTYTMTNCAVSIEAFKIDEPLAVAIVNLGTYTDIDELALLVKVLQRK